MTTKNKEELPPLEPCPFCGNPDVSHWGEATYWETPRRIPNCTSCGATAPTYEAWNRRASVQLDELRVNLAPLSGLLERARKRQ